MEDQILYKHKPEVHNTNSAYIILPLITNLLEVNSIIDLGCGTGTWLKAAQELGIKNIKGIDGNYVKKEALLIDENYFEAHDLSKPLYLDKKFDLALSLEVAEHLPIEASEIFIDSLINLSDTIVFSAATKLQGGQNHLNEQNIIFWKKMFEKRGYKFYDILRPIIWDNEKVDFWYSQNIFIVSKLSFEKKEVPEIINIIHPKLYEYRVNQLINLKKELNLKSDNYDNFKPIIPKILKYLSRIINF